MRVTRPPTETAATTPTRITTRRDAFAEPATAAVCHVRCHPKRDRLPSNVMKRPTATPQSSIVVRPQPMDSATYTASSRLQAAGLARAQDMLERSAAAVPLPPPDQPITIADYGTANGYNALLPIGAAIAELRARTRADHAIAVTHTDVPGNDFTALFTTLNEDPDSYLTKDAATYAYAVGRSFYKQILPSDSITLGWSSWATHWLSRLPAAITDHIHISRSTDDAARQAFARQAAEDWHDFVAFRGRELAPGGRSWC